MKMSNQIYSKMPGISTGIIRENFQPILVIGCWYLYVKSVLSFGNYVKYISCSLSAIEIVHLMSFARWRENIVSFW